jgi:hypothetical protein
VWREESLFAALQEVAAELMRGVACRADGRSVLRALPEKVSVYDGCESSNLSDASSYKLQPEAAELLLSVL